MPLFAQIILGLISLFYIKKLKTIITSYLIPCNLFSCLQHSPVYDSWGKSIWTGKCITLVLWNAILGSVVCRPGILWDNAGTFALNGLDVNLFYN